MSQDIIGYLTWPVIGLAALIAIFILVKALAAFYVRVPPNKAAFFYGAKSGKKGVQKVSQPGRPDEATVTVLPPGTAR